MEDELLRKVREEYEARRTATAIPPQFAHENLLYNPASQTLIAQVYDHTSDLHERRLFVRSLTDTAYTAVGNPGEGVWFKDAVSAPLHPYLFFLSCTFRRLPPGRGRISIGGDPNSVERLDLVSLEVATVMTMGEIVVPAPYRRGRVSKLMGVYEDMSALYATCGLEVEMGNITQAEYFLCRLDLASKRLELLSRLDGTLF